MNSKNKSNFTLEEKLFIQRWKFRLNEQEVPRSEWAAIIQQELYQWKKNQRKLRKQNSGFRKWLFRVKRNFQKILLKLLMKKQFQSNIASNDTILDTILENMEKVENMENMDNAENSALIHDSFNIITEELRANNPNSNRNVSTSSLGKNLTFITSDQQRRVKKQEVFFDFDDD
ncbi:MAG: hypothetical protein K9W44_13740 [Candidatus Lokiarchaeota archaeon]|nr:hypothetical protein [Candidatus Harpocratesius repetitus]